MSAPSLNLADLVFRVTRHQVLILRIHEQIERFEDKGPDQRGVALWFYHGAENAIPAQQLYVHTFHLGAEGAATVRVVDTDLPFHAQPQFLDHPLREDEIRGGSINHSADRHTAHLVRGEATVAHAHQILVVGDETIDGETAHVFGPLRTFGSLCCRHVPYSLVTNSSRFNSVRASPTHAATSATSAPAGRAGPASRAASAGLARASASRSLCNALSADSSRGSGLRARHRRKA